MSSFFSYVKLKVVYIQQENPPKISKQGEYIKNVKSQNLFLNKDLISDSKKSLIRAGLKDQINHTFIKIRSIEGGVH